VATSVASSISFAVFSVMAIPIRDADAALVQLLQEIGSDLINDFHRASSAADKIKPVLKINLSSRFS